MTQLTVPYTPEKRLQSIIYGESPPIEKTRVLAALYGLSISGLARDLGVTPNHLRYVLLSERKSPQLLERTSVQLGIRVEVLNL